MSTPSRKLLVVGIVGLIAAAAAVAAILALASRSGSNDAGSVSQLPGLSNLPKLGGSTPASAQLIARNFRFDAPVAGSALAARLTVRRTTGSVGAAKVSCAATLHGRSLRSARSVS